MPEYNLKFKTTKKAENEWIADIASELFDMTIDGAIEESDINYDTGYDALLGFKSMTALKKRLKKESKVLFSEIMLKATKQIAEMVETNLLRDVLYDNYIYDMDLHNGTIIAKTEIAQTVNSPEYKALMKKVGMDAQAKKKAQLVALAEELGAVVTFGST